MNESWYPEDDVSKVRDPMAKMKLSVSYATYEEEYHQDYQRADVAWAKSLSYFLEWVKRGR